MAAVPPFKRLMIFADGENLVFRYQQMLVQGWVPRSDGVTHIRDVLIWHQTFSQGIFLDEVLRATYYTYVVGDELKVKQVQETIKSLSFLGNRNSTLPMNLTPRVFKKPKASAKTKEVDIQLTVDVLNQIHSNNIDTVLLLSGDGDYIPLIEEIQRCGKQCFVSAFSDGLNDQLRYIADKFYCLDHTMFPSGKPSNGSADLG